MASTYCVLANIHAAYGTENVTQWSDLDNDADSAKKAARITAAIAYASEKIDDVARTTNLAIPLANASASTPTTITNLAAILAGLWLYEARGTQDMDARTGTPIHRLAFRKKEAEQTLDDLRAGAIKLDAL